MFCALAVYLSLSCTMTEKNTLINLNRMRPAKENIFYSPNGKMYKKKKKNVKVNTNVKYMLFKIYKNTLCNVVKA